MKSKAVLIFLTLSLQTLAGADPSRPLIVLDPGHGGSDHGASISGTATQPGFTESRLTFLLSQAVGASLLQRGARVAFTRTEDRDVPLTERTAMANRLKGDIFVSLHLNSAPDSNAQGYETYFLNQTTDAASKRLADLENKVISGGIAEAHKEGDLALILKDLMLTANTLENHRLACAIQTKVTGGDRRRISRGVKQGLFYVLLGADMPAVLLEAGFIQSTSDRTRITQPQARAQLGDTIAQGILDYLASKKDAKLRERLSKCPTFGQ